METTVSSQYPSVTRATNGKVTIEDYPLNHTVSITMVNLQAEDSGIYSCAYPHYPDLYYLLKTISLIVFKGEYLFPHTKTSLVRKQHHSLPRSVSP